MKELLTDWSGWIVGASFLMFLGSLWFVTWFIVRLPRDYFLHHNIIERHPNHVIHYISIVLRNLLGSILITVGVAMLVLPGQGVITILMGLSIMTFPGKQKLLLWILERKSVRRAMNWIRKRAHKPPLVFES